MLLQNNIKNGAYYPCQEGTGEILYDIGGNNLHIQMNDYLTESTVKTFYDGFLNRLSNKLSFYE